MLYHAKNPYVTLVVFFGRTVCDELVDAVQIRCGFAVVVAGGGSGGSGGASGKRLKFTIRAVKDSCGRPAIRVDLEIGGDSRGFLVCLA